jgi:hypothetical protein
MAIASYHLMQHFIIINEKRFVKFKKGLMHSELALVVGVVGIL